MTEWLIVAQLAVPALRYVLLSPALLGWCLRFPDVYQPSFGTTRLITLAWFVGIRSWGRAARAANRPVMLAAAGCLVIGLVAQRMPSCCPLDQRDVDGRHAQKRSRMNQALTVI